MAKGSQELDELRSSLSLLTDAVNASREADEGARAASRETTAAKKEEAAASRSSGKAVFNSLWNVKDAAVGTVNAMYGLAKVIASIGEDGRKFAEKVGTTSSKGAQFQMDINRMLLSEVKKFGADQGVIMENIKGTYSSFADVFSGASAGMQVSAKGVADFSRNLSTGFKSEFTLTTAAMRGLITVGISTTRQFDAFRRASGLAGVSTAAFTNLVNKNALSFMLYGPSFARAARDAERLGISLATVQKAQESMVTNLDGTIDTVAQLNQLGANIDFGSLVTMAETQGPEATLKYLQSTIPPSLFQSASTRALISKLGIPLEALLQSQGSVQEKAASAIERALTEVERPASAAARSLANLNESIKNIDNAKIIELMNAVNGLLNSVKNLASAIAGLVTTLYLAGLRLLTTPKVPPKVPGAVPGAKPVVPAAAPAAAPPATGGSSANVLTAKAKKAEVARLVREQGITGKQARAQINAQNASIRAAQATPPVSTSTPAQGTSSRIGSRIKALRIPARARLATQRVTNVGKSMRGGGALAFAVGGVTGYAAERSRQISAQEALIRERNTVEGTSQSEEAIAAEARRRATEGDQGRRLGAGMVQGGSAAAGTAIGAAAGIALAPFTLGLSTIIGPIIGGVIGNLFGEALNKYFPSLSAGIGVAFGQLTKSFDPVKKAFGRIKESIQPLVDAFGTLFSLGGADGKENASTVQRIGDVLGYVMKVGFLPLNLILQFVAYAIRFAIDNLTVFINTINVLFDFIIAIFTGDWATVENSGKKLVESIVSMIGNLVLGFGNLLGTFFTTLFGETLMATPKRYAAQFLNWMITQYNRVPWLKDKPEVAVPPEWSAEPPPDSAGFAQHPTPTPDAVSRPNYGNRMLITPTGRYALHNNDNVIAYANDLSDGVKTLSYGALAPRGGSADMDRLGRKVEELIAVMRDAKTDIRIDNKIQQVPRMGLSQVGVYTRNERV